ncbi:UNVERIFIED_CONTAM: Ornithine decarboxylase [Sesamum angustifolium]|uniref:Ornithine decarboxylase n=1 Tax=Sesamum angustifolium TaxID=2727405 RepID=A0AAW2L6M0_9LAMI
MIRWTRNLLNITPTPTPFYAVKCNPDPPFLNAMTPNASNFDCASRADMEAVLSLDVSADDHNSNNDSGNDLKSDCSDSALVPVLRHQTLSKDAAMGLVLSAANVRGWTTGSVWKAHPYPLVRTLILRTTRAINPHAYTDGTVFVQCCGCNVFHKLVDNLNLFHEMKCYVNPSFNPNPNNDVSFKYFDLDEDKNDDIFPLL